MTDLKPCPFCGGEMKVVPAITMGHSLISHRPRRSDCVELTSFANTYRKQAIVAWNRRAEWVSVEDRLPENSGAYIVTVDTPALSEHLGMPAKAVQVAYLDGDWVWFSVFQKIIEPSHWQPLPALPLEVKDE